MAKIKNISPLGDLSIPSLGIDVKSGEVVEVSNEAAAELLGQPDNWTAADKAAASVTPSTPDQPAEAN
jgi:hypothetical protein